MTEQPTGPNPEDSEPTPDEGELTSFLESVADENGVDDDDDLDREDDA